MSRPKLRKRQLQIYEYICSYTSEHGYPPSVRDIGLAIGLRSPSTVHTHLHVLQELGYIKRDSKKPRAIELTCMNDVEEHKQNDVHVAGSTLKLPVVGQVAAGLPILATENIEDYIQVPTEIVGGSASFVLRVKGDSMINAGIHTGDYVVVQQQPTATNGEIVVAMIDSECTMKRFFKEKGYVRLQPENDLMKPIIAKRPIIVGKVVGLFRRIE